MNARMQIVARFGCLSGLSLLLWLTAGCVSFEPPHSGAIAANDRPQAHLITGVPFIPQEEYYCGPASLASVLQFYGVMIDQDAIAAQVYLANLRGTLTLDMLTFPGRVGLQARSYRGSLDNLKSHLTAGQPLILFLNLGSHLLPRYHYLVAIGFDEREQAVIAHSGTTASKRMPYRELLKAWEKTDYWALFIQPPSVAPSKEGAHNGVD